MSRLTFTQAELAILEVLWARGPSAIRDIVDASPERKRPAFTTVQTVVYRLEKKGAVRCVHRIGNANIFQAVLTRQQVHGTIVDDVLKLFGGQPRPVMARLVETGKLTLDDIKEAEQSLRSLTRKGRRR